MFTKNYSDCQNNAALHGCRCCQKTFLKFLNESDHKLATAFRRRRYRNRLNYAAHKRAQSRAPPNMRNRAAHERRKQRNAKSHAPKKEPQTPRQHRCHDGHGGRRSRYLRR